VTRFRGELCYDGGLTNFIPTPPNVKYGVQITCFPAARLSSVRNIDISPDAYGEALPYTMQQVNDRSLQRVLP
jgi:hypothetical protein